MKTLQLWADLKKFLETKLTPDLRTVPDSRELSFCQSGKSWRKTRPEVKRACSPDQQVVIVIMAGVTVTTSSMIVLFIVYIDL